MKQKDGLAHIVSSIIEAMDSSDGHFEPVLVERLATTIERLGEPRAARQLREAKFDRDRMLQILEALAPDIDN